MPGDAERVARRARINRMILDLPGGPQQDPLLRFRVPNDLRVAQQDALVIARDEVMHPLPPPDLAVEPPEEPELRDRPPRVLKTGPSYIRSVERDGLRNCSTCGTAGPPRTRVKTADGLWLCPSCFDQFRQCKFCGWVCPIEKLQGKVYVHCYCEECGPAENMLHVKQEPDPTPTTSVIRSRKERVWTTPSS